MPSCAQAGDHLPGGAARRGVEAGRGLVEEDELGVADQRERHIEPAPLAAGQPGAERVGLARSGRPGRWSRRCRGARGSSRRTAPGTRARSGRARARTPAARRRPGPATPPPAAAGSAPSTRTSPPVRWRKPSRISTVVVLPAPFGPRKAKISPRRTSRSMPATASWPAIPLDQAADADYRLRLRRGGGRLGCAAQATGAVHLAPLGRVVWLSSLPPGRPAGTGVAVETCPPSRLRRAGGEPPPAGGRWPPGNPSAGHKTRGRIRPYRGG